MIIYVEKSILGANNSNICLMRWESDISIPWVITKLDRECLLGQSYYTKVTVFEHMARKRAFYINWPRDFYCSSLVKVSEEKWKKYLGRECSTNRERQVSPIDHSRNWPIWKERKGRRDKQKGKGRKGGKIEGLRGKRRGEGESAGRKERGEK